MKKMNFQNIKNVLSRDEMKKIIAGGSGDKICTHDSCSGTCYNTCNGVKTEGTCSTNQYGCMCSTGC